MAAMRPPPVNILSEQQWSDTDVYSSASESLPITNSLSSSNSSPPSDDSHDHTTETFYDAREDIEEITSSQGKGKNRDVGQPRSSNIADSLDLFNMSPFNSPVSDGMYFMPTNASPSTSLSPDFTNDIYDYLVAQGAAAETDSLPIDIKGKRRATFQEPPTLTPFSLSSNDSTFAESLSPSSQGAFYWSSFDNQTPSTSYTSQPGPTTVDQSTDSKQPHSPRAADPAVATPPEVPTPSPTPLPQSTTPQLISSLSRAPSRTHSFSHGSAHSVQSIAARSMSAIKSKLRPSSFIRRKGTMSIHHDDPPPTAVEPTLHKTLPPSKPKHVLPWLPLRAKTSDRIFYPPRFSLKGKGRSDTAPSVLTIGDTLLLPAPPPRVVLTFSDHLPREVKLHVFACLVILHQDAHENRVREGNWSVAAAKRERWVNKEAGMRELVKLSRVSMEWQSLTLDGQLWSNFDLHAFPNISSNLMLRIVGPFVHSLILRGHNRLTTSTLLAASSAMFIPLPSPLTLSAGHFWRTQLVTLDLQGCTSITSRALHHILVLSPGLQVARLRGLSCVTNATCDVLGTHCSQLRVLDLGRCSGMDNIGAMAFLRLASQADDNDDPHPRIPLTEFRMSGLKNVTDSLLEALARLAPDLSVLDLSGCRSLCDSAIQALVTWDDARGYDPDQRIILTSREMGLDPGDPTKYYRRRTHLRHINISSCPFLTDASAGHLAFVVPDLEFFEMAGSGSLLQDAGIIRLFKTIPLIRRIDLEDALDLTDAVLDAITPEPLVLPAPGTPLETRPPQPGQFLEHIILSNASTLTSAAMSDLIKNCEFLRVMEVDGTSASGAVIKEFIKLSRKRFGARMAKAFPTRPIGGAEIVAIDCRSVSESAVRDLTSFTRPRRGQRKWEYRKLGYEDLASIGVDPEDDAVVLYGQDECDEKKVILKTFWSWTGVDAVTNARRKAAIARKKKQQASPTGAGKPSPVVQSGTGKKAEVSTGNGGDSSADNEVVPAARWISHWSLSRRTASSGSDSPSESPVATPVGGDDRGCIVM